MPELTTQDGTKSYYEDWGTAQPIVFSDAWPLSADAWDDQMIFLASRGYRALLMMDRAKGDQASQETRRTPTALGRQSMLS